MPWTRASQRAFPGGRMIAVDLGSTLDFIVAFTAIIGSGCAAAVPDPAWPAAVRASALERAWRRFRRPRHCRSRRRQRRRYAGRPCGRPRPAPGPAGRSRWFVPQRGQAHCFGAGDSQGEFFLAGAPPRHLSELGSSKCFSCGQSQIMGASSALRELTERVRSPVMASRATTRPPEGLADSARSVWGGVVSPAAEVTTPQRHGGRRAHRTLTEPEHRA